MRKKYVSAVLSCYSNFLFLKHGGQISVKVVGKRRNKGVGLEIPAIYSFFHKKPSKIKKLIELIRDKEDKVDL